VSEAESTQGAPEPEVADKSRRDRLMDAGLLVFIATALALGTSVLYVFGIAWGLHFPIQSYFALSDYLGITPYWLGWVAAAAVFFMYNYAVHLVNVLWSKKREPGSKPLLWFLKNHWFLLFLVPLLVWGWFEYDWYTTVCLFALFGATYLSWQLSAVLVVKYALGFAKTLALRIALVAILPIATFAFGFGYFATPGFLQHQKVSEIFLIGSDQNAKPSQPEKSIKGKVLFSLSQYLIFLRSDDVFVSLPIARVERIETPKDEPSNHKSAPAASASPSVTALPSPTATPASSGTAAARTSALSTPSIPPSTQSSATTTPIPPHK
jgi:hypothetical protein